LKVGSLQVDGTPNPDTLVVVYSELIDAALMEPGKQSQPVTLLVGSAGNMEYQPVLGSPQVANLSNGYSRVTYVVEGDLCSGGLFPTPGDYVRINVVWGVGDRVDPPNVQDAPDNLKQPIMIKRGPLNWVVKVKNNPFGSNFTGRENLKVSLKPGAKGAELVNIDATILVHDNSGRLVLRDSFNGEVGTKVGKDEIEWQWNGADRYGRLVNTGTYLLKAICTARIMGENGLIVDMQRYSLTRPIGVVRGKNNFTPRKSPASKRSGNIGFFLDGDAIKSGELFVYDASGNMVRKVRIEERTGATAYGKRVVGEWDLKDSEGRAVAEGSYLVRGVITSNNGASESVSTMVGVGK
jgi:flagellar hook assembly protein FlgD